jgi:hypothetical protein
MHLLFGRQYLGSIQRWVQGVIRVAQHCTSMSVVCRVSENVKAPDAEAAAPVPAAITVKKAGSASAKKGNTGKKVCPLGIPVGWVVVVASSAAGYTAYISSFQCCYRLLHFVVCVVLGTVCCSQFLCASALVVRG